MFVIMMMTVVSVNAQYAYHEKKAFDNMYVGAQVGATTGFHNMFPVNATFGVRVTKEFNPVFGLYVEDNVWFGSNTDRCNGVTRFDENGNGTHNVVRANNLGGGVTLNWNNLLTGYSGTPDIVEVRTITGIGWLHTYYANTNNRDDFSAKTALNVAWNIKNGHQVYLEPGVYWNLTTGHGVKFDRNGAQFSVAVGYNYFFKNSNGTHHFVKYNVGELNDKINTLRAENEVLKNKPVEVVEKHDTLYITRETVKETDRVVVSFGEGSSVLDSNAKETLDKLAGTVVVDAYASETGSVTTNQKLSEARAKVVTDYLTNRGVKISSSMGHGKTSNPVARVAVVSQK